MTTNDLRTLTARCLSPGGRLWPNGLGFDCRGWEYTYDAARAQWYALYRRRNRGAYGPSPVVAKANARKGAVRA